MTRKSTEMSRERREKNGKLAEKRKKNGRKTAENGRKPEFLCFQMAGKGTSLGITPNFLQIFWILGNLQLFAVKQTVFCSFYVVFSAIGSGYYYNNAVMGVTIEE